MARRCTVLKVRPDSNRGHQVDGQIDQSFDPSSGKTPGSTFTRENGLSNKHLDALHCLNGRAELETWVHGKPWMPFQENSVCKMCPGKAGSFTRKCFTSSGLNISLGFFLL